MSSPHCRIAFIKPSTNPEDKSETPKNTIFYKFYNFIELLTKTGFIQSFTVLANTGNYEYLTTLTNKSENSLKNNKLSTLI